MNQDLIVRLKEATEARTLLQKQVEATEVQLKAAKEMADLATTNLEGKDSQLTKVQSELD